MSKAALALKEWAARKGELLELRQAEWLVQNPWILRDDERQVVEEALRIEAAEKNDR